jgi:flagellin-specific chaperone FliS
MNQSENEAIAKAIAALENAKQTLDDESLSLNRNLDHIEAHINAALSAIQRFPTREEAEALVEQLKQLNEDYAKVLKQSPPRCPDVSEIYYLKGRLLTVAAFIARYHLGEKS